ncbi:hypothetical protein [Microbacterium dauci]|uniref:Uncharacterized protein n=1 Tax=Microbacterium dauci TaxID=3048008 RepID=A0ABT6ZCW0_9MICO|nr:hypothetical protein [Microbacterium sp. LX3-4]MDJ1113989.1 hypothetical protein [Microbacterium sp. LX3-4]
MGERPKALLPVLIVAGVLAVAAVVVMVVLLTRPGEPAASPSEPTSPSVTPSAAPNPPPTPSPTPTVAPAASEVAMAATGFTLVGDDGSDLFTYRWHDDAASAVDALTDAFGSAPEESVLEGDGTHFPDYTSYRWGGFELRDMVETEDGKPRAEYVQPSYAVITAERENGVALVAEFNLVIGSSIEEVRALEPDSEFERSDGTVRLFLESERNGFSAPEVVNGEYALAIGAEEDGAVYEIIYLPYSEL